MITKISNIPNDYNKNRTNISSRVNDLLTMAKSGDYKLDPANFTNELVSFYNVITNKELLISNIKRMGSKQTNRLYNNYDIIILDKIVETLTTGVNNDFQMLFDLKSNSKRTIKYTVNYNISQDYPKFTYLELLYIVNILGLKNTAYLLANCYYLL